MSAHSAQKGFRRSSKNLATNYVTWGVCKSGSKNESELADEIVLNALILLVEHSYHVPIPCANLGQAARYLTLAALD